MEKDDWMGRFAKEREEAAQAVREAGAKADGKDYETINLAMASLERHLNERCKELEASGMALSIGGLWAKVSRNPESSPNKEMLEVQVFFDETTASGRKKKSFASLGLVDKGILMQGAKTWERLAGLLAARDALASNGAESTVAVAMNEAAQMESSTRGSASGRKAPKARSA